MTAWYIDALDARAGIAMTSLRGATLKAGNPLAADTPVMWIAPPGFNPEPLATPNIGFSFANRHHVQQGLFDRTGEIGFDSVTGVAEFVRRAYLRGAAGDGPDESGGSTPPIAPQDPDAPEELRGSRTPLVEFGAEYKRTDGVDPVLDLKRLRSMWPDSSRDTDSVDLPKFDHVGRSYRVAPMKRPDESNGDPGIRLRRLARGALHVLREIRLRRPNANNPSALFVWRSTLQRYLSTVTHMGLWPVMRRELDPQHASWAFGAGPLYETYWPDDVVDDLLDRGASHRWPTIFLTGMTCCGGDDVFDDLASFPVPKALIANPYDAASLQTLLSATLASPLHMAPGCEAEIVELTLFAAACLMLPAERATGVWGPIDAQAMAMRPSGRIALRAHIWLTENLPTVFYDKSLEDLLETASNVRA